MDAGVMATLLIKWSMSIFEHHRKSDDNGSSSFIIE
jgi:hypothetical protein